MIRKIIISCFLVTVLVVSKSQDIHFSQYNQSPIELNPALSGFSQCDVRVGLNARTQWATVSQGNTYSTFGLFGDMAIGKPTRYNSFAGVGVSITSDIAGAINLNTNKISLNGAYHFMLDRRANSSLSFGLQFAVNHRGINPAKGTFDSQWNPNTGLYDQSLPRENFARSQMIFLDAGAGIFFNQFFKNQRHNMYLGLALTHVNQPEMSFYNTGIFNMATNKDSKGDRLYMKVAFHGGGSVQLSDVFWLNPNFLFLLQGPHKQINIGAMARMRVGHKVMSSTYLSLGASFRAFYADAVIIHAKLEIKKITFGFSYDINTSKLNASSNSFGGPEVSLIYQGCMNKKVRPIFCPVL